MDKKIRITVSKNGPYLVNGKLPMDKEIIEIGSDGQPVRWAKGQSYPLKENYALCRCGQSKNKPYCDGSHAKVRFDGTKTASRKKYLKQAEKFKGPELDLTDAKKLCSGARFCSRGAGTWKLTKTSDKPAAKEMAIQEACDCPSGRLVAWDKKTARPIEPDFEPAISLVEDPQKKVSGPIWVKGKVPIASSDGFEYEIRNRVTLCRCGKSRNKPFCDTSHIEAKFSDGDKSLNK